MDDCNSIRLDAYAKINLFLDVSDRRNSGYHTILSSMHTVSLADTVEISVVGGERSEITLECSDPMLPNDAQNLAYLAAKAYLDALEEPMKIDIKLTKRIPMAAGLAGGSTDAAAVIRGLNALCGDRFTEEELCSIGSRVGADVPFCIVGGSQTVEGVGDVLSIGCPLPDCSIVIACSGEGVSTPEAYSALDEKYKNFDAGAYCGESDRFENLCEALENSDIEAIGNNMFNSFESVILPKHPAARKIKEILEGAGAVGALMSGSGPSVFGIFEKIDGEHSAAARVAVEELAKEGIKSYLCEPVK